MAGTKGRSGRRRKNTALKLADGDPGKRLSGLQPVPEPTGDVHPPDWLTEPALVEWNRLADEHERCGLLTTSDVMEFAIYCQSVADLARARMELIHAWDANPGFLVNAKIKPPIFSVIQALNDHIHKLAGSLGMNPQGRGGLAVKATPAEEALKAFAGKKPQ